MFVTPSSGRPLLYLLKKMYVFIIFLYLILKESFSTVFLPVVFHVPVIQFPISVQT
jgi:hypothetical protein